MMRMMISYAEYDDKYVYADDGLLSLLRCC